MADRVLTARQLNRAVLARQLLLQRSDLPLVAALEQVAGIQAQYAPSAYVGLWSRVREFPRESLTLALNRREVVQATLMRVTIHIVSAADFWPMATATRRARQEGWLRAHRPHVSAEQVAAAADLLRQKLHTGPLKQRDLLNALEDAGHPRQVWSGIGQWLDMVRVPPSGTWAQRRADLYGLADTWVAPEAITEPEALTHLISRYLRAFGPASVQDIVSWGGLTPPMVRSALETMQLERFRDEAGRELLDLPGQPLPDPDMPAPARFIPTWDAILLVHARRALIVPERYRPLIFNTRNPQSVPTFLVDGSVAGTWRVADGQVQIVPFEPLPQGVMKELEHEAARLAAFHAQG